jgi:mono/diheme cytochrome c family protein
MKFRSLQNILIASSLLVAPSFATARQTMAEKAAARSAFWGLFADQYRALGCISMEPQVRDCLRRALKDAERHAVEVDMVIGANDQKFAEALRAAVVLHERSDISADKALGQVALDLKNRQSELLQKFASASAPALPPDLNFGATLYREHCMACHGDGRGGQGSLTSRLRIKPRPLVEASRTAFESPVGIYAVMIHGVEGSEMLPMIDVLSVEELWSVAFYVSALPYNQSSEVINHQLFSWLSEHRNDFSLFKLASSTDSELAVSLNNLGRNCGTCTAELAALRLHWAGDATRLGEYTRSERQQAEARGLTILISLIVATSLAFGFILRRRSSVK